MIFRGVGRVAAAVVVIGFVGLVSGCAAAAPAAHRSTTPSATSSADPASVEQELPDLLVAGQTIGTGELRVVDHEPIANPVADHPVTGAVRIMVGAGRDIEVHIRPDDPAATDLTGIDLLMSGHRRDGGAENIQDADFFALEPTGSGTSADGELVLTLALTAPFAGDPTFLHSLEESPSGDARVFAATTITWSLPSAYPGLTVTDGGVQTYAHGRTVVDGGTLAYYVPNPYDTIYEVSRRFGLTETQLVWLNPELFMHSAEPQLTSGIGVNLDPARR
jgi:hypothetical protein